MTPIKSPSEESKLDSESKPASSQEKVVPPYETPNDQEKEVVVEKDSPKLEIYDLTL